MERERRRRIPRGGAGHRRHVGSARAEGGEPLELEVLEGLAEIGAGEARELGLRVAQVAPTALTVRGERAAALRLRTVVAAYAVLEFAVPRPRGLLGEEHLSRIAGELAGVEGESFRISAAGRDSAVYQRLAAELEGRTGKAFRPDDGDVVLRIRPSWQVLVRLTPRPLATRAWRVRDFPGALNATIAAAMLRLAGPQLRERYLNLMCGSGTLLAECPPVALALGIDNDRRVLALARENVETSLLLGDIARLPLQPGAFDVIAADLPYGERSGAHASNDALYRAFLAGAAEAARAGARLVVISHDIRRFEAALLESPAWAVKERLRVFQKGYRPTIWLLRRSPR